MSRLFKKILNLCSNLDSDVQALLSSLGIELTTSELEPGVDAIFVNADSDLSVCSSGALKGKPIISLSNDLDIRNFLEMGGKGVIDQRLLKSDIGKKILERFFSKQSTLQIEEAYNGVLGETGLFKLSDPLNIGYYSDVLVSQAYKNGHEGLGIRNFFSALTSYLIYLNQMKIADFPLEVDYGSGKDFFLVQIHTGVENFFCDHIWESLYFGKIDNPYKNLIRICVDQCDVFDVYLLKSSEKIVFTGIWLKQESKKDAKIATSILIDNIDSFKYSDKDSVQTSPVSQIKLLKDPVEMIIADRESDEMDDDKNGEFDNYDEIKEDHEGGQLQAKGKNSKKGDGRDSDDSNIDDESANSSKNKKSKKEEKLSNKNKKKDQDDAFEESLDSEETQVKKSKNNKQSFDGAQTSESADENGQSNIESTSEHIEDGEENNQKSKKRKAKDGDIEGKNGNFLEEMDEVQSSLKELSEDDLADGEKPENALQKLLNTILPKDKKAKEKAEAKKKAQNEADAAENSEETKKEKKSLLKAIAEKLNLTKKSDEAKADEETSTEKDKKNKSSSILGSVHDEIEDENDTEGEDESLSDIKLANGQDEQSDDEISINGEQGEDDEEKLVSGDQDQADEEYRLGHGDAEDEQANVISGAGGEEDQAAQKVKGKKKKGEGKQIVSGSAEDDNFYSKISGKEAKKGSDNQLVKGQKEQDDEYKKTINEVTDRLDDENQLISGFGQDSDDDNYKVSGRSNKDDDSVRVRGSFDLGESDYSFDVAGSDVNFDEFQDETVSSSYEESATEYQKVVGQIKEQKEDIEVIGSSLVDLENQIFNLSDNVSDQFKFESESTASLESELSKVEGAKESLNDLLQRHQDSPEKLNKLFEQAKKLPVSFASKLGEINVEKEKLGKSEVKLEELNQKKVQIIEDQKARKEKQQREAKQLIKGNKDDTSENQRIKGSKNKEDDGNLSSDSERDHLSDDVNVVKGKKEKSGQKVSPFKVVDQDETDDQESESKSVVKGKKSEQVKTKIAGSLNADEDDSDDRIKVKDNSSNSNKKKNNQIINLKDDVKEEDEDQDSVTVRNGIKADPKNKKRTITSTLQDSEEDSDSVNVSDRAQNNRNNNVKQTIKNQLQSSEASDDKVKVSPFANLKQESGEKAKQIVSHLTQNPDESEADNVTRITSRADNNQNKKTVKNVISSGQDLSDEGEDQGESNLADESTENGASSKTKKSQSQQNAEEIAEIDDASEDNGDTNVPVVDNGNDLDNVNDEDRQAVAKLRAAEKSIANREALISKLKEANRALVQSKDRQIEDLKQKVDKMREETLTGDTEKQRQELVEFKSKSENLESQLLLTQERFKTSVEKMQAERDLLIDKHNSDVGKMRSQMQIAHNALTKFKDEKMRAESKQREYERKLMLRDKELEELRSKNQNSGQGANAEVEAKQKEVDELKVKVTQAEHLEKQNSIKLKQLEQKLKFLTAKADSAEQAGQAKGASSSLKMKQLEAAHTKLNEANKKMMLDLGEKKKETSRLKNENNTLKTKLKDLEKKLSKNGAA